jgi:hypothetical protein
MAIPRLNAIGFCAHYSEEGDWAFDYALSLARSRRIRLNVFHFLADPYDPEAEPPKLTSREELNRVLSARERELRMYYEDRAGDYLDVGFRLCEDNEWLELHRCLVDDEFQALILGYVGREATFSGKPIEEFASSFICPVVLVGPDISIQFHVNEPAALISHKLGFAEDSWEEIQPVAD